MLGARAATGLHDARPSRPAGGCLFPSGHNTRGRGRTACPAASRRHGELIVEQRRGVGTLERDPIRVDAARVLEVGAQALLQLLARTSPPSRPTRTSARSR